MSNKRKLRKSQTDRKICGVCAGIAEYFEIDPIWVRILWLVLLFVFGTGILLYFALALIMSD